MAFLNPILLYGLAAVSVPVIIHLLNRRRFKKVPWAAMRFLRTSVQRNQRRMQVEDWILLAVRCLLVALLALAFARPALEHLSAAWLQPKHSVAVVLDNSASMAAASDPANPASPSRFDVARDAARRYLDSLPPGTSACLLVGADRPVAPSVTDLTSDLERVRAALDRATLGSTSSDLLPLATQAAATLESVPAASTALVVFTDSTSHAWRQFDRLRDALPPSTDTQVVLAGRPLETNLALTDLQLRTPFASETTPLRFDVTVSNTGTAPATDIPVTLALEGGAEQSTTVPELAAATSQTVTLYLDPPAAGAHAVTASLPADALPADDRRSVAFTTAARTEVLLVDGSPSPRPAESATFFLKHALDSPAIATTTVTASDLATDLDLARFAAVVLADVPQLGSAATSALDAYVRAGGGLVVFPGERTSTGDYNRDLHTKLGLLPASFGEPTVPQQPVAVQTSNLGHPLVASWAPAAATDLAAVRISKLFPLAAANARPALYTTGDHLLVAEGPVGRGHVALSAIAADTSGSDLPVHPSFVPFVRHLVGTVAGAASTAATFNIPAGSPFRYPLPPSETPPAEIAIYPVSGGQGVGQVADTTTDGTTTSIDHTATGQAGVYRASATQPPLDIAFAVQVDPAESALQTLSQAQLDTLREVATVTPATSTDVAVAAPRTTGADLWLPLLAAVLLLGVIELALAQRFSRPK